MAHLAEAELSLYDTERMFDLGAQTSELRIEFADEFEPRCEPYGPC